MPRKMAFSTLLLVALTSFSLPVQAQNGNHSCTIMVDGAGGILRQNVDVSVLSSRQAGGMAARATITATNGSYRTSIDAPNGFTVFPNGGNSNTEFSASFSANGATNFLSVPAGVEQKVRRGTSTVEVHMEARRLSGAFPSGRYAAEVTLRCE